MKKKVTRTVNMGPGLMVFLILLLHAAAASGADQAPRHENGESGGFVLLQVTNPTFNPNQLFRGFENYYSPRIEALKQRYGLEEVVKGEADEWRRIVLLRHWINTNIDIENDHPTVTRGDTFGILDAALQGGGFHCAHFSIVQHAVLNSFGYLTRRLGCGPGEIDDGGHHGVNEVWVNKFGKWVIIDAKYDSHFEKDGVPLSALELRDLVWKGEASAVVRIKGPDSEPMRPDPVTGAWEARPETYRWCSWETDTNRFSAFPAHPTSTLVLLDDEIFRNHKWYRDGKPHWAYGTPFMILTTRRDWIEWTPNVISSEVAIRGDIAEVFLTSCTPNFRSYQIMTTAGTWSDCGETVELRLRRDSANWYRFRTMNLFGVSGPEHRIEIEWREAGRR